MIESFLFKVVSVALGLLSVTYSLPKSEELSVNEYFSLELAEESHPKGESSGVDFLQVRNTDLHSLLEKVYPEDIYVLANEISDFRFNFEFKGDLSNKKKIREKIHRRVKELVDITIEQTLVDEDNYSLDTTSNDQKEDCHTKAFRDKITKINRLWIGECVSLNQVASHISEVFDVKVRASKPDLRIEKIEIHYDDFSTVQEYLKFYDLSLSIQHSEVVKYTYGL